MRSRAAAAAARTYESPLRAEQVERVRESILKAAVELVALDGHAELSLRKVALRSGVSVPTVYRYFPSLEALSAALFGHINTLFGFARMPSTLDGVLALPPVLYQGFEANDLLVRAYQHSPLRKEHQKTRYPMIRKVVDAALPELPERARNGVAAMVQMMLSGQTWISLHDHWSMDGKEAGEWTAWSIRTLIDAARRSPQKLPGAPAPRNARR